MIVYIDREILLDTACRDLYLCQNTSIDEHLIVASADQCTCEKRFVTLCKSDHDQCERRCLRENRLFFKRKTHSNEILYDNQSVNLGLLEENEMQSNAEIVYICEENNLPPAIHQHLKNQVIISEIPPVHRTTTGDFLLKHSILAQSIYAMYLTLQQARHNSLRLRRYANMGYLLSNLLVGIFCSWIFYRHADVNSFISEQIIFHTQNLTTWIKSIIEWLMHAPAGLKLNQPLVDFLARFYFYHIYLWSGYLEALMITVLPYLYQILATLCLCGVSIAIGAICDFLRLLTIHLYCFYIYAARLFNWQIRLLIILFRLFCGKKQNPLRNYRLDSHLCDIDQLFIVTLTFTIFLFLLPSIFMFYAVFTSIWSITVFSVKMIQSINSYLLQIPIYECFLWITGSRMIKGSPRLSVNYGYSTDRTACFNFHFDYVSFLTLYRVCNIRSSLTSLPLSQLFLAILKGQPTF